MNTNKKTPAKPKERKLGALRGKIILSDDAFTPSEMQPYLKSQREAKAKSETGK